MADNRLELNLDKISLVISLLRFPLAFLVVMIHCNAWGGERIFDYILRNIMLLAVPFFFVISGYNIAKSKKKYSVKIKERVRTILIPYCVWLLPAWIVSMRHTGFYLPGWDIIVAYPINFPLWYLRDLFILCLLLPLIYQMMNRLKGIPFMLVSLWMYYYNYIIPVVGLRYYAVFFFGVGILLFQFLKSRNFKVRVPYCVEYLIYTSTIILFVLSLFFRGAMDEKSLGFLLYEVLAITSISLIFLRTEKYLNVCKFPFNLGNRGFFIYCSHCVVIGGASVYLTQYIPVYLEIKIFLATSIAVCLCVMIFNLLKRYAPSFLRVLNGGRI